MTTTSHRHPQPIAAPTVSRSAVRAVRLTLAVASAAAVALMILIPPSGGSSQPPTISGQLELDGPPSMQEVLGL